MESGNGSDELQDVSEDEVPVSKADMLISQMTLREKIGQMIFIQPESLRIETEDGQGEAADTSSVTVFTEKMAKSLEKYPPGGIIIFGGNIESPIQLKELVNEIKSASTTPLFMGIDEEGGMVARIANSPGFDVKKYESMQKIGSTKDPKNAEEAGKVIGSYLRDYGFNLDFAPVADVNTNPENIVIGSRAFGDDPHLVADMVKAGISGLHSSGVMSCIKHFPGHGDTKEDTHAGFVSIGKKWEELEACELIPFKAGIEAETDMIMISHITAGNITKDGLPSSLSQEMIEGRLRRDLKFDGIIISDSMSMGAITERYSSGEAAVLAIKAGTDIVLMPEVYEEAFESIFEAVARGEISEERIDESVIRILSLKDKYDILI
ncbi:glycoside hydrolase family 3 protein [Proteocatella sphenisci]|uniref:glycoside hydrolase family 3 protein n=1 Tax=Proteocatella sphenisci TaxID=181070 RepID=UPI0004BBCCA2|nr:glycoside hydrolase family 3 protein [Proteocatella sphenisci]